MTDIVYEEFEVITTYRVCVQEDGIDAARCLATELCEIDSDQTYIVVENLTTFPEFRGQGYATMLLEEIIALAEERRCSRVELSTSSDEYHVHHLYQKLGFDNTAKTNYTLFL